MAEFREDFGEFILKELDYSCDRQSFLETLSYLSPAPQIDALTFHNALTIRVLQRMITIVAEHRVSRKIYGTGSIFLEQKFLREAAVAGRIEEVAVHPDFRGIGLGKAIISSLLKIARAAGCYKVTLECADHNMSFYEKCGFYRECNTMRVNF